MTGRKCPNWLKSLAQYVEDTESPRRFWLWGGVFTLCSSLQRKVWLPFGLELLYPNLYIMLVAPPGKCRKGAPLGLAKRMLEEIRINVAIDSGSKRALTKQLEEFAKTGYFEVDGKPRTQCAMAIISKELSSLLAVDPKGMIEVLTDLYDSHDTWFYGTSTQGKDSLHNICIACFLGTTPGWISSNLPEEALTGGWASRVAIIAENSKYKRVTLPATPPIEQYNNLVGDLAHIASLTGEFKWGEGAYTLYDKWYQGLDSKYTEVKDDRMHSFLERIHIMVLKVGMILRVAYSDKLILTKDDLGQAIDLLEEVLATASEGFSGQGRSRTSADTQKIITQLRITGKATFAELLTMNYRNTNKTELKEILDTIEAMGRIEVKFTNSGEATYIWKKGDQRK